MKIFGQQLISKKFFIIQLSMVILLAGAAFVAGAEGISAAPLSSEKIYSQINKTVIVTSAPKATNMILIASPCYKSLNVKTKKIVKSTATLDLNVEYPQIGQAKIDKNLTDFIGQTIKDFGPGENSAHWKSSLWIRYKISQYEDKTVSVRFYIYQFTGGAHGSEIPNFRTYSLETGQRLSYNDIFKSDYQYLTTFWRNAEPQAIAAYKAKGLPMDNSELAWIREGSAPKFDNYRNFYLDNQGVVIYFSQYQAAPYAFGTLEIPIKYNKFSEGLSDFFNNLPERHILCGNNK